jgi:tetratricopeptide (TPR) repeat protein
VVGGRIERKGPLTGDQVSDIVDRMFMDKEGFVPPAAPAAAELPPPQELVPAAPLLAEAEPIPEAVLPPEPAPESVAVAPGPAPETVQEPPLGGEETAEIIEGLLSERGLGAPAIPAPEAPAMIEKKPAEEAPVMVREETPVMAREEPPVPAKGIGATATLAELYEHQGFYDKALELYEQVLAENPENNAVAERVRELRSKSYWGEGVEAEVPEEPAPTPEIPPSEEEAPQAESLPQEILQAEVPHEEAYVKEIPVVETLATPPPEETVPEVLPRKMEEAPGIVMEAEKEAAKPGEGPAAGTPLFHPEAGPKPEGTEPGKEIKSFQEWLDSLKKPKT